MYLIKRSDQFDKWLRKLKDRTAVARILLRLKRIELGSIGDAKSLKHHLYELKIDYGPGYRIYFTKKDDLIVFIISGGDKSTQSQDIKKAKEIISDMEF